jgi:RNA polymerase sigma-70 factor (ECF subfamily)
MSTGDGSAERACGRTILAMNTTRDDQGLAERFRAGDPDAVRAVYRRYAGSMLVLARSRLADPEQAHDAVQQAFLQAWRAAGSYDARRPLSTWLYAITRRVCVDLYRRDRRRPVLTETGDAPDAPVVDVAPAGVERDWEAHEVRAAVDGLRADERDLIRLAYFEGLSLPEVAERLDLPVGTVKSRSFRAYRRLAQQLRHLRAEAVA